MRLPCPFCGSRDSREFVSRGDAAPVRPAPEQGDAAMVEYLYLRDNPAGTLNEWWYHAAGCRQWMKVTRDTVTHRIAGAQLAGDAA